MVASNQSLLDPQPGSALDRCHCLHVEEHERVVGPHDHVVNLGARIEISVTIGRERASTSDVPTTGLSVIVTAPPW